MNTLMLCMFSSAVLAQQIESQDKELLVRSLRESSLTAVDYVHPGHEERKAVIAYDWVAETYRVTVGMNLAPSLLLSTKRYRGGIEKEPVYLTCTLRQEAFTRLMAELQEVCVEKPEKCVHVAPQRPKYPTSLSLYYRDFSLNSYNRLETEHPLAHVWEYIDGLPLEPCTKQDFAEVLVLHDESLVRAVRMAVDKAYDKNFLQYLDFNRLSFKKYPMVWELVVPCKRELEDVVPTKTYSVSVKYVGSPWAMADNSEMWSRE